MLHYFGNELHNSHLLGIWVQKLFMPIIIVKIDKKNKWIQTPFIKVNSFERLLNEELIKE